MAQSSQLPPQHIGLLLAAGAGTRFGGAYPGAKLDQRVDGVCVGIKAFTALQAACDAVVVVVRDRASILAVHAAAAGAQIVLNEAPERGMGHSMALGAQHIMAFCANAQFIWVSHADTPFVDMQTFYTLRRSISGENLEKLFCIARPVFAPTAEERSRLSPRAMSNLGRSGHPVIFARGHWQALAALDGDQGARALIAAHHAQLLEVPVSDEGIWRDIDRPEDLYR